MSEALFFVNTYKLKDGKLAAFKEANQDWLDWNEKGHPRLLHHEVYVGDDGVEVTNIQVHPDSASMEQQMELVADVHGQWREYIDWSTMRIQLYGNPSDVLLKSLRQLAGSGVPVTIRSPLNGFSRLPAR